MARCIPGPWPKGLPPIYCACHPIVGPTRSLHKAAQASGYCRGPWGGWDRGAACAIGPQGHSHGPMAHHHCHTGGGESPPTQVLFMEMPCQLAKGAGTNGTGESTAHQHRCVSATPIRGAQTVGPLMSKAGEELFSLTLAVHFCFVLNSTGRAHASVSHGLGAVVEEGGLVWRRLAPQQCALCAAVCDCRLMPRTLRHVILRCSRSGERVQSGSTAPKSYEIILVGSRIICHLYPPPPADTLNAQQHPVCTDRLSNAHQCSRTTPCVPLSPDASNAGIKLGILVVFQEPLVPRRGLEVELGGELGHNVARGDGLRDEHASPDGRPLPHDGPAAQNHGARVDRHVVLDGGVSFGSGHGLAIFRGQGPQSHAVEELDVVADVGGLA